MTFQYYGSTNTPAEDDRPKVDYTAMNKAIVEAVNCETPQTLQGVISQIIDLGLQDQPDAKFVTTDDEVTRKENTESGKCYYVFDDEFGQDGKPTGKQVWFKMWKSKPTQEVALVIDFPSIIVDKGVWFGDSNPQPYRLIIGGSNWCKHRREFILNRPAKLRVVNLNKDRSQKPTWSLGNTNILYKMAVAAEVIEGGQPFLPNQIGELLGKALLFEISCKINDKGYLNERVKLTGKLMRGMSPESLPYPTAIVGLFDKSNDPEMVKNLRSEVINHIKRSSSFVGSALEEQLAGLGKVTAGETTTAEVTSVDTEVKESQPEQRQQEDEQDPF